MARDKLLEKIGNSSDILIGVGIVTILIVMLMPIPTMVIDFLLTINFLLAFIIVLVPVYIASPSDFTVFPGLLLIVTLFRLSLNVATTRLILGEAQAGKVIEVFGSYTIRGNYIVGIIIFLILVLINFLVITKGSGRVAEVAARFTLDAMPGKQMAIDADLNNGIITEKEAEERRDVIRREADFYGAMDGASKFVKGDAIAGLIITGLNIVAGIIIGMLQRGYTFSDALQKYTILTVGDGLVSQVPALLISSAAGLIVTRSGTRESLGRELVTQLLQEPKVLYIAGTIIMFFAFTPGMPAYFFAPISLITIGLGYITQVTNKKSMEESETKEEEALQESVDESKKDYSEYLQVEPLELEIGYSLINYVNEDQDGDLLDRISSLRKEIAMEIGILIPLLRIRDNLGLVPNQYIIKIRGEEIASSECLLNHYLALDSGAVEKPIKGIKTREPAFNMPAVWITEDKREKAEMHGYTVIEPPAMIATHISEVIKANAENIITRQDVQNILDNIKKTNEAVVDELVPNLLSVGNIEQVLKNLLHERVPIRDMMTILETLADYASVTRDVSTLTEYVRFALSRTISKDFISADGVVYGITFSPKFESMVSEVVNQTKHNNHSALPPQIVSQLYEDIKIAMEEMHKSGLQPLVLTSPLIRSYVKKLIEPAQSDLPILSFNEIPTTIPIHSQITLDVSS